MSAIDKICAKKLADCTPLEKAVRMYLREDAAEQLAAMEAVAKAARLVGAARKNHPMYKTFLAKLNAALDNLEKE
jgi:hypothetical protein